MQPLLIATPPSHSPSPVRTSRHDIRSGFQLSRQRVIVLTECTGRANHHGPNGLRPPRASQPTPAASKAGSSIWLHKASALGVRRALLKR